MNHDSCSLAAEIMFPHEYRRQMWLEEQIKTQHLKEKSGERHPNLCAAAPRTATTMTTMTTMSTQAATTHL